MMVQCGLLLFHEYGGLTFERLELGMTDILVSWVPS
jgi:hypothetical protein